MRTPHFIGSLASAAAANPESNLPTCTTTGESGQYTGTQTTECTTPGNVQIDATAPEPDYPYPWDDEFYGAALIIGNDGHGPHRGGGGGSGHQ
jgi:hypothetical protein